MKNSSKYIFLIPVIGLLGALAGCGRNNANEVSTSTDTINSGNNGCPVNQVKINNVCVPVGGFFPPNPGGGNNGGGGATPTLTFDQQCQQYYGQIITLGGVKVCKQSLPIDFCGMVNPNGYSYGPLYGVPIPRLSQSNPNNPTACYTQAPIRAGDRISYSGSGTWGTTAYKCDTNLNTSLMASDGMEVFNLSMSSNKTFTRSGDLRLGFNLNSSTTNAGCLNVSFFNLKLMHCEDENGVTYPCP